MTLTYTDRECTEIVLDGIGHQLSRESFPYRIAEISKGYVVVAEWEDAQAYQGWLDNPVRDELGAQLEPLLAVDVAPGELFEEV